MPSDPDALATFEAAARNLEIELAGRDDGLTRLKLDAVRAQAEGLRAEVAEYAGAEACD